MSASVPFPSPSTASLAAERMPTTWVERGSPAYGQIGWAFFLAGFVTFSLLYCVQSLLPTLAVDFRVSPVQSSLALSLTTGSLSVAILISGALSEAVGRRGLMFASMLGASGLNLAAALVPGWHGLLLLRALEGVVLGGVPAVAMAYLSEEIHPASLGLAMGRYVGGTAFGGMIGRVGVGLLTEVVPWRAALSVVSLCDLVAVFGFFALLPPSRHFTRRAGINLAFHLHAWGGHLRNPRLALLFLVGFLAMGANVMIYNFVGFRLSAAPYHLSASRIGLIFTVYLCGVFTSAQAGAWADRYRRGPVLACGLVVMALGVALTLAHPLFLIIGGVAGLTIGFFGSHAVASGWIGSVAPTAKGHAASLYLLAYYQGSSVVGSAGGWFLARGGWAGLSAFACALLALAFGVTLLLMRLTPTRPDCEPASRLAPG